MLRKKKPRQLSGAFFLRLSHGACAVGPPGVIDLSHIAQGLLAVIGALIRFVSVIETAFTQVARERLVPIALRVLRPRVESGPRQSVKGDDSRLSVLRLLLRIDPTYAVDCPLPVVHSLQQRAHGIEAEWRQISLIDIGEDEVAAFARKARRGVQKTFRRSAERRFPVNRNLV